MSFLTRLEGVYLNILRVVILLLATLLLLASIAAAIFVVPKLIPEGKPADARSLVQNDRLADFKRYQRGEPANVAAPETASPADQPGRIDSRIKAAAAALAQHGRDIGGAPNVAIIEDYLNSKQKALPETLQGDYADSVQRLAAEVSASKDRSLDVAALIDWHDAKFVEAEAQATTEMMTKAADKAAKGQLAMMAGGAALTAFGLFLLLIFVFVLVKIERNLREVAVAVISVPRAATSDARA